MERRLAHRISLSLDSNSSAAALYESGRGFWTYNDLQSRVDLYYQYLLDFGVRPGQGVALSLEKSMDHVAVILACIKLRTVYIPLDAQLPQERLLKILVDSKPFLVLSTHPFSLEASYAPIENTKLKFKVYSSLNSPTQYAPEVQCILYTSGSTGTPKGVMISDENIYSFVEWSIRTVALEQKDVVASLAPFYFDLSTFDLFASLVSGASVVLFDHKAVRNPRLLTQKFKEYAVTRIYTTPTLLRLLMGFGKWESQKYDQLRTIIFAGEVMPPELLIKLRDTWLTVDFYNWYGPTETNVVTCYQVPKEMILDNAVPVGHGCDFALCRVEEEGVMKRSGLGELHVGGPSVAFGYVGIPESKKFYEEDDIRYYATGDTVRIESSGMIHYVGRLDRMIKRHGNRVELGDIESASIGVMKVIEAGAIYLGDNGGKLLLVVKVDEGESINLESYREELTRKLPGYMIPDHIFVIPEWPLNRNHKTDYSVLEKMIHDRLKH